MTVKNENQCQGLTIEMLNDSTQAVSVSGDDDLLSLLELGNDDVVPVWQGSRDGELQRLELRELVLTRAVLINRVLDDVLEVLVVVFHRGWWGVEGASPDLHLFFSVLLGSFGLVHASQASVVTFVQAPCLLDGYGALTRFFQDGIESHVSSLQHACVGDVELQSGILDSFASIKSLLDAFFTEIGVVPAAEEIQLIPLALAVADHDNLVLAGHYSSS